MSTKEQLKFHFVFFWGLLFSPFFILRTIVRCRKFIKEGSVVKRVLVVPVLTRVGDLVCATPVLRELKLHDPNIEITLMLSRKNEGIVEFNSRIDHRLNINNIPHKGFWGRLRFFSTIRRRDFDAVILLTNSPFNNLVSLFSCAPIRAKTIRQNRLFLEFATDWFNNYRFLYRDHTSLPRHYLRLLEPLGIFAEGLVKEVFVS
ncbi:MAG: hypothetical protein AAB682_01315 [Patescibacteria group bacterium]